MKPSGQNACAGDIQREGSFVWEVGLGFPRVQKLGFSNFVDSSFEYNQCFVIFVYYALYKSLWMVDFFFNGV